MGVKSEPNYIFVNSAGYSEGFEEKNGKCERKGRLTILKLQGHWGIMHFGNSKDQVGGGGGEKKMEAVRGMVWIFSGIAQCDPIHCSPRGRMGILGAREAQGAHEEGGTGTPARMLLLFTL